MSVRWIRNVLVEGEKTTLEILLGDKEISDKCYTRINSGEENWFVPQGENRDQILEQGIHLLQKMIGEKKVTRPNGDEFPWN